MKAHLRAALTLFVLLALLTGVAYPLLVTLIAQAAFPYRANGSVLERNGKVVGSELIGQPRCLRLLAEGSDLHRVLTG